MQKIHTKLTQKYRLYHNWHQTKHHNKIHWGVLAIFTLLVFGTMLYWTPISLAADTVPPTIPTNLTAAIISSSQINLSWTASTDNVGVTGYKIYRCSGSSCIPTTQISTSATNLYSDTGLTSSTVYTYDVSAYDAAGNESGKSSSALATTLTPTANTYYIAATGTDNAACGSSASPCAAVQYVLDNKVSAGDIIKIKPGTYNLNSVISINNPKKHSNITLTAEDPNNKPLLRFSSTAGGSIRIGYLDGSNPNNDVSVPGVTISYLKIESAPSRITTYHISIEVTRESNPVIIDHNEIYNGFIGIGINTGKNVIVSNNKIYAMGVPNPPPGAGQGVGIAAYNFLGRNLIASGWNEKIYIYNNEVYDVSEDGFINVNSNYKYIEMAYNNFHDNGEDGLDWKDTQYVRIHHSKLYNNQDNGLGSNNVYPSTDFEIWDNEIYNNGWYGIVIQGGSNDQKNWKIWNNLIYGNARKPETWGADGVVLSGSGHEFYHNLVYNNTTPAGQSNAGIRGGGIIKNNIFYNNASSGGQYQNGNIASTVSGTIDHNYVYPTSPGITGTNAITAPDPMLTNAVNGDFTLKSGSPLIDAGVNVGITTDFAGNARPQGAGYDIGAYEYGGTPPPPDTTPPTVSTNLTVTPISSTQINLSWTASTDNVGVAGYKIYRCSGSSCTPTVQIATSATNSYLNTGLTASTAYTYAVSAYDAAGNESGKSSSASATTLAQTGNTYYISPTGSDTNNGSELNSWATLRYAFSQMVGGDTLIIKDGTYTGINNVIDGYNAPPNGSPSGYTIIKAEQAGKVTFDGNNTLAMFDIQGGSHNYLQFEGLQWINSPKNGIQLAYADHVKFLKCGAESNMWNDNKHGIQIARSTNILLEDCYVWGQGRFGISIFISQYVIVRRTVVRLDAINASGMPIAHFMNYSSGWVECQNCIAIDSDSSYFTNFYEVEGSFTTHNAVSGTEYWPASHDSFWRGSIGLNVHHNTGSARIGGMFFDDTNNLTYENMVLWDVQNVGMWGKCVNCSWDHFTIGKFQGLNGGFPEGKGWDGRYWTSDSLTNSIIYGANLYGLWRVENSNYNVMYNNAKNYYEGSPGANDMTIENGNAVDPIDGNPGNGIPALKYLVRVENGSELYGSASDGGNRGATILKRIGVSGTLWGEPGYNTLTDEDLWPWPYENQIKADFATYNPGGTDPTKPNGKRGFAADGNDQFGKPLTITRYIWQYLGNQIPCEIYNECGGAPDTQAPLVPTNLTATAVSSSQINLSWTASTDNVGATGYKIYRNGQFVNSQSVNSLIYNDTGLTASTAYTYAVSAYDAAGNESAKSSFVSATTFSQFKPSDLNQDAKVDQQDFDILKQDFNRTDKPISDLNQDGIVDSRDLGIMMSEWSK